MQLTCWDLDRAFPSVYPCDGRHDLEDWYHWNGHQLEFEEAVRLAMRRGFQYIASHQLVDRTTHRPDGAGNFWVVEPLDDWCPFDDHEVVRIAFCEDGHPAWMLSMTPANYEGPLLWFLLRGENSVLTDYDAPEGYIMVPCDDETDRLTAKVCNRGFQFTDEMTRSDWAEAAWVRREHDRS